MISNKTNSAGWLLVLPYHSRKSQLRNLPTMASTPIPANNISHLGPQTIIAREGMAFVFFVSLYLIPHNAYINTASNRKS